MFQRLLFSIARLLAPMECPLCGGIPLDGTPGTLCAECFEQIHFFSGRRCPGCGGELHGIFEMCQQCMESEVDRPWGKAYALFKMEDAGRELIHLCKYKGHPEILRTLAHTTVMALGNEILAAKYDLIVPIPLFWFRRMQRGYNQSQIFCECLGSELDIPVCNAMRRVKWTKQQAMLSKKERIRNLSTAFSVKNLKNVENRAILLVDDVFTTGATLASATKSLLDAGAARVDVFAMARR